MSLEFKNVWVSTVKNTLLKRVDSGIWSSKTGIMSVWSLYDTKPKSNDVISVIVLFRLIVLFTQWGYKPKGHVYFQSKFDMTLDNSSGVVIIFFTLIELKFYEMTIFHDS